MTIKNIINEKDGNNIESIIFNRIKRHSFMLYPFSDVKPVMHTVIDEKKFLDGIYVELQGNFSTLIMRVPQQMLIKMVAQEFYNPFYEDDLREIYKRFMENEDKYKNLKAKGIETPAMKNKICIHIFFNENKPTLLKWILGGLGL